MKLRGASKELDMRTTIACISPIDGSVYAERPGLTASLWTRICAGPGVRTPAVAAAFRSSGITTLPVLNPII